jgi:hypothetical protein
VKLQFINPSGIDRKPVKLELPSKIVCPTQFLSRIQHEILLQDEFERRMYASLFRCLERASVEKRLPLFSLAARFAAEQLEARRQQAIDDLRTVAAEAGLVRLLGATAVQDAIREGEL